MASGNAASQVSGVRHQSTNSAPGGKVLALCGRPAKTLQAFDSGSPKYAHMPRVSAFVHSFWLQALRGSIRGGPQDGFFGVPVFLWL